MCLYNTIITIINKRILKWERYIPLLLLLIIFIDISLTTNDIIQMNENGIFGALLKPVFIPIFFV